MSSNPYDDDDLMIQNLTATRRQLRSQAEDLAGLLQGNTVEQIESNGQLHHGDAIVRFIRGDYQPRRLDGVVHAWLDDTEVVVRTQFGRALPIAGGDPDCAARATSCSAGILCRTSTQMHATAG